MFRNRRELAAYRVASAVIETCSERAELIAKLKEAHARHDAASFARSSSSATAGAGASAAGAGAGAGSASDSSDASRERLRERISREVESWTRGKSIQKILNDVNGMRTPDKGALRRSDSFTPVARAYRKAMLKVHPDKAAGAGADWTEHHRATEMFKAITEQFNAFKKLRGR